MNNSSQFSHAFILLALKFPPFGEIPHARQTEAVKHVKHTLSCVTLGDPVDCSPPDSSDHGIFQVRILNRLPFPTQINTVYSLGEIVCRSSLKKT